MEPILDDQKVSAFWLWFKSIAGQLSRDYENLVLLTELDAKVSELGDIAWEVGPGSREENALVISPNGVAEWLPATQQIIAAAPSIPSWELHPARPPKAWNLEFSVNVGTGNRIDIDARGWRYVLFRYPDGIFDLVLEQNNLLDVSDEDRFTASMILLDGLLGEAARLSWIHDVETVIALQEDQSAKASSVSVLAEHLALLRQSM